MNQDITFKEIKSTNYWFKIDEFLQANWALIEESEDAKATIFLIGATSEIFDEIHVQTLERAVDELVDNGYELYSEATQLHKCLQPPCSPFTVSCMAAGKIL